MEYSDFLQAYFGILIKPGVAKRVKKYNITEVM